MRKIPFLGLECGCKWSFLWKKITGTSFLTWKLLGHFWTSMLASLALVQVPLAELKENPPTFGVGEHWPGLERLWASGGVWACPQTIKEGNPPSILVAPLSCFTLQYFPTSRTTESLKALFKDRFLTLLQSCWIRTPGSGRICFLNKSPKRFYVKLENYWVIERAQILEADKPRSEIQHCHLINIINPRGPRLIS